MRMWAVIRRQETPQRRQLYILSSRWWWMCRSNIFGATSFASHSLQFSPELGVSPKTAFSFARKTSAFACGTNCSTSLAIRRQWSATYLEMSHL